MRVDLDWVKSTAARRILIHWADPRPAWLWSADGTTLLWRNGASRFFGAKLKKHGLKLAAEPVPIRGQVNRLIRLGSPGRSSLSRIQFLAGGRPASTTASVTPLELEDGAVAALIVGVDPIEPEILAQPGPGHDPMRDALFPRGVAYLLLDADNRIVDRSSAAAERFAPLAAADGDSAELDGEQLNLARLKASPQGHQLLLVEGAAEAAPTINDVRAEEGLAALDDAEDVPAPEGPMGPAAADAEDAAGAPADGVETEEPTQDARLSSLFDRLADNEALYGELTAADELLGRPKAAEPGPSAPEQPDEPAPQAEEPDVIAAVIAFEDDIAEGPDDAAQTEADDAPQTVSYRVIGRGFTPPPNADAPLPPDQPETPNEPDIVERTSRYNFDELSRILADRVSGEVPPYEPVEADAPTEPAASPALPAGEGSLVNIAAETFILNRLPLGILVFRDQQMLFANRALTDLLGYDNTDRLRSAGLTAIFPSEESTDAGPVTHLVRSDGTLMPVTARLQSIAWHGRPALMLSAAAAESRIGHEGAVRTFAETLAELRGEGLVLADRAGVVTMLSATARTILGKRDEEGAGEPLSQLIHPGDLPALREFLERPARFAETARPGIVLRGPLAGTTLILFTEGQAGVVAGYFGFVQKPQGKPKTSEDEIDSATLARVSRGVRRPLNTIIGFADLIRSAAFGTIENHRYLEYARDIKTAGQEIAVLVEELDDYSRLKAGKYAVRPAELDLGGLLESCVVRVRGQANAARVLVRSAISERLPHVRADRASLGQAVLNLLASAIDQTPAGGSVILSAQVEDDGSIAINVRDSGQAGVDPGERFVVFRDGVGKDGEALAPVRSSVGLALTRSLVAVNACTLSVDPAGAVGTLFSLVIPAELVAQAS